MRHVATNHGDNTKSRKTNLTTCEIRQHGREGDRQQDQADAETLPGAPVLAPLVDVEPGRGVRRVVRGMGRLGRTQGEHRHHQRRLLGTPLQ
jgi:hypothetical protein